MKLSIITINRNNAAGLRKTMESVFAQTYKEFEYIVVDGASDDDSVNVIKEFEQKINPSLQGGDGGGFFTWLSEPDTGIYNAMNKGIEIALGRRIVNALNRSELREDKNKDINRSTLCGDKHCKADRPKQSGVENKDSEDGYVLMLNSGDFLVDEHVIERTMPELDGTDIVQGNNIEMRNGACYRNRGYGRSDIDLFDVVKGLFLHQASFCRMDLFKRYGYFDESYTIAGDTKFFISCLGIHDSTFKYVNIDICNYDCYGLSAPLNGQWNPRGKLEYNRILSELFSVRMQEQLLTNEKKVRFYDKMHQHKWIWGITMWLAHLNNAVYGEKAARTQCKKIDNC